MKTKVDMPKEASVTIKLTIAEAHELMSEIKESSSDLCKGLHTDITSEIGEA